MDMDPVSRYLHDTTPLSPAEQAVLRLFQHLECGRLRLGLPGGQIVALNGALPGPEAELTLPDTGILDILARDGLTALPTTFAAGLWQSRDLTRFLYLVCRNPLLVPPPPATPSGWRATFRRLPRRGTAPPTAVPPPLPDAAFFRTFLGENLDDGPGLFQADTDTPTLAQASAVEALLQALGPVRATDHLLEIGGGWGVLGDVLCRSGARLCIQSAHLPTARHIHARLTALHPRQSIVVRHIPILRLGGRYERIVWVMRPTEPLPVPDAAAWNAVFRHLKRLLKQDGRLVMQALTLPPDTPPGLGYILFGDASPPPRTILTTAAARAWIAHTPPLSFGPDAARLAAAWGAALAATLHIDTPTNMAHTIRRWLYHLAALEAGHLAGAVETWQTVMTHQPAPS